MKKRNNISAIKRTNIHLLICSLFFIIPMIDFAQYSNSETMHIYFHIIRKKEGKGNNAVSISEVENAFESMKQYFIPHGICFTKSIGYIDDNDLYNYNIKDYNKLKATNHKQDAINIYCLRHNNSKGTNQSFSIPSSGLMILGNDLVNGTTLAHEIGHCLGLYHTFRGYDGNNPNDPNACKELVNGTNSNLCGDEVEDTPADPGMAGGDSNALIDNFGDGALLLNHASGKDVHIANGPIKANLHVGNSAFINNTVGIGTTQVPYGYKLAVYGNVIAEDITVDLKINWPDYVFSTEYKKMSIKECADYIQKHKHLPGMPSKTEVKATGIRVGEMQTKMLEKIEEQMLYIIELNKEIHKLKHEIEIIKVNR